MEANVSKLSKRIGICSIVAFTLLCATKLNGGIGAPIRANTTATDGSKPTSDRYIDPEKAQKNAIKRWDARIMQDILGADNVKKITDALNFTREDSEPRKLALSKWDELSLIDIRKATTLAQTLDATNESRTGSPAELAGFKKIDLLCMEEVEKVKTLEDVLKTSVRVGSGPYKLLREKRNQFGIQAMREANSIDQLWDAYNKSLEDDEAKKVLSECWDKIALAKSNKASTFEELLEAFSNSRSGSEARKLAIIKAAKFLPEK